VLGGLGSGKEEECGRGRRRRRGGGGGQHCVPRHKALVGGAPMATHGQGGRPEVGVRVIATRADVLECIVSSLRVARCKELQWGDAEGACIFLARTQLMVCPSMEKQISPYKNHF
jgi:hypothetical protein